MINQGLQNFETIETDAKAGWAAFSVAGVPFVFPLGSVLQPWQVEALQGAAQVARLGRRAVAEAIVAQVQRELGVSQELHALGVAVAAAKVAQAQRVERQSRDGEVRRAVVTAQRAQAEPEASKPVKAALRKVEEFAALAKTRRARAATFRRFVVEEAWAIFWGVAFEGRGDRVTTAAAFDQLVADANRARTEAYAATASLIEARAAAHMLRQAQLAAWRAELDAAETAQHAQVRGERIGQIEDRIDQLPDPRTMRPIVVEGRDGLRELFHSGAITAHEHGAGRAYRTAFELPGKMRVQDLSASGGGGKQHGTLAAHRSAAELARASLLARLKQIELAVGALGDRELYVLQQVAGLGNSISSLGRAGSARKRNTEALRRALEAAVQVLAGPVHRGLKRAASS